MGLKRYQCYILIVVGDDLRSGRERQFRHLALSSGASHGVYVSRIPPIDGLIAYRRDAVIDARTGSDLPTPEIATQVRIRK